MKKLSIIILFISCCFLFISCVGPTEEKNDIGVKDQITHTQDSTMEKNDIPKINEDENKTKKTKVDNRNHQDGFIGILMFFWEGVSGTCRFVKTHKPSWWQ